MTEPTEPTYTPSNALRPFRSPEQAAMAKRDSRYGKDEDYTDWVTERIKMFDWAPKAPPENSDLTIKQEALAGVAKAKNDPRYGRDKDYTEAVTGILQQYA